MYGIYHKQTLKPIIKPQYQGLAEAMMRMTEIGQYISTHNLEPAEESEIIRRKHAALIKAQSAMIGKTRVEVVK